MQKEFGQIIMKNGKSRLLGSLTLGDTLIVNVGTGDLLCSIPNGFTVMDIVSFKEFCEMFTMKSEIDSYLSSKGLSLFDRVIFYSNEPRSKNLRYIEIISRHVNLDKCIFMFSSQM